MSTNMTLIEAKTAGSGGVSNFDFTSIPATYTDLKLVTSLRAGASTGIKISFNNSTSGYTMRSVYGIGSGTPTSDNNVISDAIFSNSMVNDSSFTASTFANGEVYIPNYTSSNNKSVSIDAVTETNATTALQQLVAGLWSNSAVISSIKLVPSAGNFAEHSTAYLYGISNVTSTTKATGGIVSSDGTYNYHMFPFSGTFTPTTAISADILVVAGGGGSGDDGGGGGGGGGLLYFTSQSLTATGYSVTVGAGGARQTVGGDSQFGSLTLVKGGGRGSESQAANAGNGGSGGGGGAWASAQTFGGSPTSGQGYAGGGNGNYLAAPYPTGGGGGAGAVGGDATSNTVSGNGGIGIQYLSFANATQTGANNGYYAGGGGGAIYGTTGTGGGAGGLGGGGAGVVSSSASNISGTPGLANTGGGAGGGNHGTTGTNTGASGGSGVVIIRYAI